MNLNSKIGLGSVQFGMPYGVSNNHGQTTSEEVIKILSCANKSGITLIDTASAYGNAEEILGYNNLSSFKISSKFIPHEENHSIGIQLKTSLEKLSVDRLYGYLAHRPLSLIDNPKQWKELLSLKEENKVEKIGFSLNEPRELDLLLSKGMIPDLIQVPYNYFDNRFKDILIDLKDKGCEIHTRSSFLQGLFFSDIQRLPSFFDEVKKDIAELQINFADNLSGVLLKYVLSLGFVDVVIVGVENEEQLKNNLRKINATHHLPPKDFNFSDLVLMPSNWPTK